MGRPDSGGIFLNGETWDNRTTAITGCGGANRRIQLKTRRKD